jgi:hypothetical protein
LPTRLRLPVIACYLKLESRNLNDLALIRFCLARATGAGGLRREAPAIRAGGRPGFPIPGAARPMWPLGARALSDLLDRKPHLWRPLAEQLLPPPASFDPAEHLGIDLDSVRTAENCRQVLATVLAAIGRGEIAPAEGARVAELVRGRLRAARRLARVAQLIGETL